MADTGAAKSIDPSRQAEMIAVAAYFRAEQRDFASGNELEDWLQAEEECKAGTLFSASD